MSELGLGLNQNLLGGDMDDADSVHIVDHFSGGNEELDKKDKTLLSDLKCRKCGGNEELDQKYETLLSDFKSGKCGGYSTNGGMGCPCRISSPSDKVDKQQKEIYDSVREFIGSHVAAGNFEALNHELKNGKGTRADYLRTLVRARKSYMKRAASPKACARPPIPAAPPKACARPPVTGYQTQPSPFVRASDQMCKGEALNTTEAEYSFPFYIPKYSEMGGSEDLQVYHGFTYAEASTPEYLRRKIAAGNCEGMNLRTKYGKGTEADYLCASAKEVEDNGGC